MAWWIPALTGRPGGLGCCMNHVRVVDADKCAIDGHAVCILIATCRGVASPSHERGRPSPLYLVGRGAQAVSKVPQAASAHPVLACRQTLHRRVDVRWVCGRSRGAVRGCAWPACAPQVRPNVPAEKLYDKRDDGLSTSNSWAGYHVLLNPPFTSQVRAIGHVTCVMCFAGREGGMGGWTRPCDT